MAKRRNSITLTGQAANDFMQALATHNAEGVKPVLSLVEQLSPGHLHNLRMKAQLASMTRDVPVTIEGPEWNVRFIFLVTPELLIALIDEKLHALDPLYYPSGQGHPFVMSDGTNSPHSPGSCAVHACGGYPDDPIHQPGFSAEEPA